MLRAHATALLLLLLPLLLAVPEQAEARGLGRALRAVRVAAGAARVYGRLSTGEDVLTVAELAGCLRSERAIDAVDGDLAAEQAALDAEATRIDSLSAGLARDESRVDQYDTVAVEKFNVRVTAARRAAKAYEARGVTFNASVVAHNTAVAAHNAACYGRSYYEDDYSPAERLSQQ